jgi:hypothetical protein
MGVQSSWAECITDGPGASTISSKVVQLVPIWWKLWGYFLFVCLSQVGECQMSQVVRGC